MKRSILNTIRVHIECHCMGNTYPQGHSLHQPPIHPMWAAEWMVEHYDRSVVARPYRVDGTGSRVMIEDPGEETVHWTFVVEVRGKQQSFDMTYPAPRAIREYLNMLCDRAVAARYKALRAIEGAGKII